MQLLTRFDRAVFRSGMHHPFNLRSIDQYGHVLAHSGSPRPDLIVDLVGDAPPSSTPVLSLMSNGMTGETALSRTALACMTSAHQLPQLAIMYKPAESENVVTLLTAYPALEEPHHFTASLFRLCQRACDLICQAIPRITDQQTSCPSPSESADLAITLAVNTHSYCLYGCQPLGRCPAAYDAAFRDFRALAHCMASIGFHAPQAGACRAA